MSFKTADLCDQFESILQIAQPGFNDYGATSRFCGEIVTLKLFEDNSLVRELVKSPGNGKVLVVDAGGSMRCAVLGDLLAAAAVENGWAGLVINGCIRDSADIAGMALGVKALATHPLKTVKRGIGDRDLPVTFMGVTFRPGEYVYCDEDGVITAPKSLLDSE